jgi:hypothetical protein
MRRVYLAMTVAPSPAPCRRVTRIERETEQALLTRAGDRRRDVQQDLRPQHAGLDDADAARLFDDVLHTRVHRVGDEADRLRQAGNPGHEPQRRTRGHRLGRSADRTGKATAEPGEQADERADGAHGPSYGATASGGATVGRSAC